MKRSAALCILPFVAALGLAAPATAQIAHPGALATATVDAKVQTVQWGGYGYGYRGGYGRHYGGGWGPGAGVAAGVAGLAAGAIVGGAIAQSQSNAYYGGQGVYAEPAGDGGGEDYCIQRFRSYDPSSGTYLGNDGYRHSCP